LSGFLLILTIIVDVLLVGPLHQIADNRLGTLDIHLKPFILSVCCRVSILLFCFLQDKPCIQVPSCAHSKY